MVTVQRFTPALREDFFKLHSDDNGCGWCFCVAWWVSTWDNWDDRTAEENRSVRNGLLDNGEYDGYLLYVDATPAGWCQVGPRDRLAKLVHQISLAPSPETWALTCFFIAPHYRRQGYASHMLREILDDLRRRDVRRVEAFPKRGEAHDALDLWTGPESIFRQAGFAIARDDANGLVVALDL